MQGPELRAVATKWYMVGMTGFIAHEPPDDHGPNWAFADRFVAELPGDPSDRNVPREVRNACFSRVTPTAVAAPRLLAYSREVASDLGFDPADLASPAGVAALSGNRVLPGMKPYAACYGGHQFGHWAGQLGDGRAMTLGEVVTPGGTGTLELQLKGAGPTPYSRRADGRAVLRSSVREFLCSEAMFHLGVPTTRALSLVMTGDDVVRDMLYDGHPKAEPGAIVARVSPSFVRFGSFELPASRGDVDVLRKLADYVVHAHYPHLLTGPGASPTPSPSTYAALLGEVAERTAKMVAGWMRVGFVHGVMNTDNMSILGLTIDYGPYGWLEGYDPGWTPNTTDATGRRYRYGAQPRIAAWNMACLVEAFGALLESEEAQSGVMDRFALAWSGYERAMYADKLGLREMRVAEAPAPSDVPLVEGLMEVLRSSEIDMTLFFRSLAEVPVEKSDWSSPAEAKRHATRIFTGAFYEPAALEGEVLDRLATWLGGWAARVREDARPEEARRAAMNAANPKYVLRNWLAQVAIDAAADGSPQEIETLLDVMRKPYEDQPGRERYAEKRPEWARHRVGCSALSCSS